MKDDATATKKKLPGWAEQMTVQLRHINVSHSDHFDEQKRRELRGYLILTGQGSDRKSGSKILSVWREASTPMCRGLVSVFIGMAVRKLLKGENLRG